MTPKTLKALDRRSQQFLEDLTEPMGRSERRHWARVYLQGLLLDGERKSIEPMAARVMGREVTVLEAIARAFTLTTSRRLITLCKFCRSQYTL